MTLPTDTFSSPAMIEMTLFAAFPLVPLVKSELTVLDVQIDAARGARVFCVRAPNLG